jgi:hypothetical protein
MNQLFIEEEQPISPNKNIADIKIGCILIGLAAKEQAELYKLEIENTYLKEADLNNK